MVMDCITTCSEMYHDRCQSLSASSLFLFSLSSFRSSKKIWMYTWVCSNLSSPLAQVRSFPFYFQNFSRFTLCLFYWGTITEWYKLNTEKYVWLFIMFFFQVGGLISLRRMIAVDFTVLSGTSAPYFKLSDAWLSISSEKSLLHVSLMPWQWWRGQFSKCTFQFIKKCFLGLHHYNILFDMLQQNCHSTVNSFHS